MKELYEAPELNLISYIPMENLAASIEIEDMLNGQGGKAEDPISGEPKFDY